MTYHFILPDLRVGGAEHISLLLARELVKDGIQVQFVNLVKPSGKMKDKIEKEFNLVSLGCRRSLTAIPSLVKYLRKHHGDCVFTSLENAAIASLIACRFTGNPVTLRLPNMPSNQLHRGMKGVKFRIMKWVTRKLYKRARYIIAQTDEMRDQALSYYGLPADKVVTVYNPLDEDFVRNQAIKDVDLHEVSHPRFLAVGTITYRKGVDVLLEAFTKVRKQYHEATLTIIGNKDGNYARNLVEKHDGKEGVRFYGFCENPYPFMAHCDVFVLPSRMEGFPNVLLEAMCLNKPVVATTCLPVIQQIVKDGVNGYVCPVEDAEKMASSMTKALDLKDIHNTYSLFDRQKLTKVFLHQ